MQDPRLIVLALVAQGRNYGLAMEEFVDSARMRLWAKIGTSTIYKALKDLEADGCLTSGREQARRGPGKKVYALTAKGRAELARQVGLALGSEESVYSDRIAGLVFALSLGPGAARPMVDAAIDGMGKALADLERERGRQADMPMAMIVLDFYRAVYQAERDAMHAVRAMLASRV